MVQTGDIPFLISDGIWTHFSQDIVDHPIFWDNQWYKENKGPSPKSSPLRPNFNLKPNQSSLKSQGPTETGHTPPE